MSCLNPFLIVSAAEVVEVADKSEVEFWRRCDRDWETSWTGARF